jgi:polysaccharide biosynthesis protein PelA
VLALSLACGAATRSVGQPLDHVTRWWIFLGKRAEVTPVAWRRAAEGAELVILNHDQRLPIEWPATAAIRLAYLSVGEAEAGRPYWPQVRGKSFVIEPNPAWPDNVRVDIRDRRWQEILLDQEVPRLLAEGYQGIMLDTLDTAPYLERKDPVRFAGCRHALGQFLSVLRRTFPAAILLANGTETLVDAAPYVDGYVTEGIFATYELADVGYRQTTPDERGWRLSQVQAALARVRRPVFSIEYASGVGAPGGLSEWATRQAREYGFRPYVTNKSVDRLPEPIVARSPAAPPAR